MIIDHNQANSQIIQPIFELMSGGFCTIITRNFLSYAKVLYRSIREYDHSPLYVLVTDITMAEAEELSENDFCVMSYHDLIKEGVGSEIAAKYLKVPNKSIFRWSMKPVVMQYLLQHKNIDKVIFFDADICIFNSPKFLWETLDHSRFLLTPHWRDFEPGRDPENFDILYTSGIYNAGFVGASKEGLPILDWWAKACSYMCELNPAKGNFGDQTHLNLIPVYFEDVHIVRHLGCNVANWNMTYCERSVVEGEVRIRGDFPIVFIHFTGSTIRGILKGKDGALMPFLKKYDMWLSEADSDLRLIESHKRRIEENLKKNRQESPTVRSRVLNRVRNMLGS